MMALSDGVVPVTGIVCSSQLALVPSKPAARKRDAKMVTQMDQWERDGINGHYITELHFMEKSS